jgi:hypothetical protein
MAGLLVWMPGDARPDGYAGVTRAFERATAITSKEMHAERDHPPLRRWRVNGFLEHLAGERIEHEPIETYSNGVRHVKVPDPDGNAIAFAEPPDAASASD